MRICLFILFMFISCNDGGDRVINRRTYLSPTHVQVETLKHSILRLEGTVDSINNFIANDYSSCSSPLTDLEIRICQIAQSATAEQLLAFSSRLQEFSRMIQRTLYGNDCASAVEPGCPRSGSVLDRMANVETNIDYLQYSISALTSSLFTLEDRLNNFDGSGSSIETVIANMSSDLNNLRTRIENLEDILTDRDVYKTIILCGDIPSSGPLYEAVLMTGDRTTITAYIEVGSVRGLGVISHAGVTGTQFLSTTLNTRTCNFKIYDLITRLEVCWKNTNRSATSAAIDDVCLGPSRSHECTCVD